MTRWVCGAGLSLLVFASTACNSESQEESPADDTPNAAQSVNDDNGDGWPLSTSHFETLESAYTYTNTTTGAAVSDGDRGTSEPEELEQPLVSDSSFYLGVALGNVSVNVKEAMSAADWAIRTRKLSRFFKHLTQCALDAQHTGSMTVIDASGAHHPTYTKGGILGKHGLAPQWADHPLGGDVNAQERITGCMLAHMNKYGVPVNISIRSPSMRELTPSGSETTAFPLFEGAFWGNIFSASPKASTCYNRNQQDIDTIRRHTGRECAVGTCSQIQSVGACGMNNVCTDVNPGTAGFKSCNGNTNVVTVFLSQDSLDQGEFAKKTHLEDDSFSCPQGSALAGVSAFTSLHGAICKKSGIDIFSPDGQRTTLTRGSSVHGVPRPAAAVVSTVGLVDSTERWPNQDPSRFECAPNEYISAIAGKGGDVSSVTCTAGNMRGDVCRTIRFGDKSPSATGSDNWSDLNVYTECGLGEHVAGVYMSRTDIKQSRMLCCAD